MLTGLEESCSSCHLRLLSGMYCYRIMGKPYCQGCVNGPYLVEEIVRRVVQFQRARVCHDRFVGPDGQQPGVAAVTDGELPRLPSPEVVGAVPCQDSDETMGLRPGRPRTGPGVAPAVLGG